MQNRPEGPITASSGEPLVARPAPDLVELPPDWDWWSDGRRPAREALDPPGDTGEWDIAVVTRPPGKSARLIDDQPAVFERAVTAAGLRRRMNTAVQHWLTGDGDAFERLQALPAPWRRRAFARLGYAGPHDTGGPAADSRGDDLVIEAARPGAPGAFAAKPRRWMILAVHARLIPGVHYTEAICDTRARVARAPAGTTIPADGGWVRFTRPVQDPSLYAQGPWRVPLGIDEYTAVELFADYVAVPRRLREVHVRQARNGRWSFGPDGATQSGEADTLPVARAAGLRRMRAEQRTAWERARRRCGHLGWTGWPATPPPPVVIGD